MKNFKLILLTCFCLFLSTVSCDKEPVLSQNQDTPNVIQARANAAAKARKDIDKAFLNYDFSKYKIIPMWDLAVVAKNKKSVEVPYLIDGKMIMPVFSKNLKGRQRLLLTLEKSKVSVMIVQYFPNTEFKGNIREIYAENFQQKKFNGKIVFQTLGIDKMYIWILKNGKVEGKKTGKVIGKGKNLRPSGWEQRCETVTYWYETGHMENGEYVFDYGYTVDVEECYDVWVEDENDDDDDDNGDDDPTDCNMHPELPWCDSGEGGGGGDPCGNSNGRTNCAECNDMAALVNEEPSMVGEVESYQLNDLGGGSREAILRVRIASHSVYDLYSNPKVVIVPNGEEHLKFQSIEDGTPYVLTKKSFVVTNEVTAQNVNHNSYATLIFNGTVYITFNLAITCSIPPFEGTVGPFIDPHQVNNVRKDINPYMFQ
jgi:hypothetical protein